MKVMIAGTGNVAFVLSRLLMAAGHSIVKVYGRNALALSQICQLSGASPITDLAEVTNEADIFLLAVSDTAISKIANQLHHTTMLVVHTSGATSQQILNRFENYGVLYPLQSLRKEEINHVPVIPFYVDANKEENRNTLLQIASSTGNTVSVADDRQRLKLHLAAVLSSNFANHLYALTNFFCNEENIDFRNLLPLIQQTVNRLQQYPPAQMQTGPAIRNDNITMEKHLEVLTNYPDIQSLYTILSHSIQAFAKGR